MGDLGNTAPGKLCKLRPYQRLDIAFLALKKVNLKCCNSKTNDDSKLLLRLNNQYHQEVFCSVFFEFRWVVYGGTWLICVLGQLVNEASNQIKPFGKKKNI